MTATQPAPADDFAGDQTQALAGDAGHQAQALAAEHAEQAARAEEIAQAEVIAHDDPADDAGRHMDILRLATAGSVDDGKSTLIGRLLYDSEAIFEDQLASVER